MRLKAGTIAMLVAAGPAHARPEAAVCQTQRTTVEMIDCGRFLLEWAKEDLAVVAAHAARPLPG